MAYGVAGGFGLCYVVNARSKGHRSLASTSCTVDSDIRALFPEKAVN